MTDISTPRLTLKNWDRNPVKLKIMVRWLNDPEVVRYSEQRHKPHTEETQYAYLNDGPDVFREIHAGGCFIGTISAYVDRANSVADVGIMIGEKDVWGKGYGFEAWEGFCNALFKVGIRKVEAGCMGINMPMIKVARKYDMHVEGRRADHFLVGTELTDMVMWGRFP